MTTCCFCQHASPDLVCHSCFPTAYSTACLVLGADEFEAMLVNAGDCHIEIAFDQNSLTIPWKMIIQDFMDKAKRGVIAKSN